MPACIPDERDRIAARLEDIGTLGHARQYIAEVTDQMAEGLNALRAAKKGVKRGSAPS
jgi:hypothetical protein